MSIYLKNFGCPEKLTRDWKKLHVTKWILLFAGLAMAVSGYYVGSSLIVFDGGHQMGIICAMFWGSAGICIIAYSIALVTFKKKLGVPRLSKYEEKLNSVSGSNFHYVSDGICTQMDEQISELMLTHSCERNSLNKAVSFRDKYLGFNGSSKGMNGSIESVYKSQTLYAYNEMNKKVSNEVSECLGYKKISDIFYKFPRSFSATSVETLGSEKISSPLERSSLARFTTWGAQTSELQNDFESNGISNNADLVFKHQPKICINENIVNTFHKDIELNNSFQVSLSSFKYELFEDFYFCQTLYDDETMELVVEPLVTAEMCKRSETDIFALEFTSFAAILLTDGLRSDILQSYDEFLKPEDTEIVTAEVKYSDKKFWSKIPMKRSNFKLTKKRCEPIMIKNHEEISNNDPDINNYEKSSSNASESSGEESTSSLIDRKTYRESEFDLSALTFMDELPTIPVNDLFYPESFAECDMNFQSWFSV